MEKMGDAMVNKLLHQPLTELKKGVEADHGGQLLHAVRRLFDLDRGEAPTAAQAAQSAQAAKGAATAVAKGEM